MTATTTTPDDGRRLAEDDGRRLAEAVGILPITAEMLADDWATWDKGNLIAAVRLLLTQRADERQAGALWAAGLLIRTLRRIVKDAEDDDPALPGLTEAIKEAEDLIDAIESGKVAPTAPGR